MNLATRCLPCGTVFRVAESQLLASDGWVRCGRCNSVFNAAEVLFDIDTGTPMRLALPPGGEPPSPVGAVAGPPAWPAAPPAAPGPSHTPVHTPVHAADRIEPAFEPAPRAEQDEPFLRTPSREPDPAGDEPITITDHVPPPATARHVDDGPALAPAPVAARPAAATTSAAADAPAMAASGAAGLPVAPAQLPAQASALAAAQASAQATPSFMRQAERAARWHQPAMRAGLWAGVLLLGLAALLQMALLWRDSLAAHLPGTAPALQAVCRLAGCSVQPLRRIQQLSVESSGLNRLEGSSLYRLQLVLRNRADTAVMMPALDLTLTDPQGQLVARRVLPAAELGVQQAALQAGQELPIKVLVSTGERRVDGYTLELFYP